MLEGLIQVVFWIITKVADIIMTPITLLFDNLFPSTAETINTIETWLDANLWDKLGFVKQCAINLGVPQIIFTFIISYYTIIGTLWAGSRAYIFGYNVYKHFKP